jgi:hypothetical protein
MHDPPAYVWAIIIAGPTAIAATTCIVLYGGAKRAGQGRRRAALLAGATAGDWHKNTAADRTARAKAGAGPGVRVTGQAGDVSGEAQVLRPGDEPVMMPIRHLASTVPVHTWTFRPGRAWTPARPIWAARRAPWLPNGVPGDCDADPARRVPALGKRSRAVHPGASRRRRTCAGRSRRVIRDADINAWYSRLLAADEARDAAALAAVAWQMYGQLAATAADLGALQARFRAYAAAPRASGRRRPAREEPRSATARRLRSRAARPHGRCQ